MNTFFDEWMEAARRREQERKKAEKQARPKGQACRTCAHFRRHPHSEKYNYCTKRSSRHTSNGFGKTTRTGWCNQWREPEGN